MFRYSFERAIQLDYYREKNRIKLKFPEPYIIILEEEEGVSSEFILDIEIPKQDVMSIKMKVLRYWDYNLHKLYQDNMYLLYPLQIFSLRKEMQNMKDKVNDMALRKQLLEQMKATITQTVEAIAKAYKSGKIDVSTYEEMTTVLLNLNGYLINIHNIGNEVEGEVASMIKMIEGLNFHKAEEKGMEKGIEKGAMLAAKAVNMIKDGDTNEKIRKDTGLDESVIQELRKSLEPKGEHKKSL